MSVLEKSQIDAFPNTYKRDTVDCQARTIVYAHGHNSDSAAHRWYIPDKACHQAACRCVWCVARNSRERARRVIDVYERLWSFSELGPRYAALVFTLPADCRTDRIDKLSELRKEARRVVSEWILDLSGLEPSTRRRSGWETAGVDVWHPEGDRDAGAWKPHIHMQVPAIAHFRSRQPKQNLCEKCRETFYERDQLPPCDACKEKHPRWKQLRVKVSKDDLAKLRFLWGQVLQRVLGWAPAHGQLSRCVVNYRWRTMARPALYFHRIKYDFRHWPQYQGYWRSIRWFGFLAPASQKRIGFPSKEKKDSVDLAYNICPECGRLSTCSIDVGCVKSIDDSMLERAKAPPWVVGAQKAQFHGD